MDTTTRPSPRLICLLFGIGLVLASLLALFGQARPGESGPGDGSAPFDYFRNSWAVLGLPDYERGTRLTPDNQMLLGGLDRVTIEIGSPPAPLSRRQVKTLLEGWLPVVRIGADAGDIRYDFLLWASPLPGVPDAARAFAGPAYGENYLSWVLVRATNRGAAKAVARVRFRRFAAEKEYAAVAESPAEKTRPKGSRAAPVHDWAPELKPGETREDFAAYPFFPVAGDDSSAAFRTESARAWLERTTAFWKAKLGGAARVSVPERKATEALLAAHVCQLLAMDKGELHAGEGFYDVFYIRDGAYQVMSLEEAGLLKEAGTAMEPFLRNQLPNGRFETQKGQFDANGQAVWALWQYAAITGDKAWLARVYPALKKAAQWAVAERRKAPPGSPFPGLLPAAPADGEYLWEGKNHIVGYDLWNLRGIFCASDAARRLGRESEAREWTRAATAYLHDIDSAWKKTGLSYFPPSWEKEGTPWGNTELLWPVPVIRPDDPRVGALSRYVRTEFAGGYKEGVIRWVAPKVKPAIHPYMGAYTSLNDLARGEDEKVVEDFYAYLLHSTAAQAFPEGVHYEERTAWGETIPHATGASNYALLLRHMLVQEAGETGPAETPGGELHLLAAVPDWWLENGGEIVVERAPTHFGEISFKVTGMENGVRLEARLPGRNKPGRIVLHLPKGRPLLNAVPGVEVFQRPAQARRWDFAAVVQIYEKSAPPLY